jgi:plastocyanin
MSILHRRLPRLQQSLVPVLVVFLAACSSASSSPTPGQGSPVAAAPSVVPASIVPATLLPTPAPTSVPVTPAPATPVPKICASSCSVMMLERAYLPRTLNIKVGTEVIWSNTACQGGCTVTFPGISLDSGPVAIGGTFKHTFSDAGLFAFHCLLDPNEMSGTIIVTN